MAPKLIPFSVLPSFGRKDADTGVVYASASGRLMALTIDTLLLFLLLTPLFSWMTQHFFPGAGTMETSMASAQIMAAGVAGTLPINDVMAELHRTRVIDRLLFEYSVQMVINGILVVFCWTRFATTPGLALFGMVLADARTGAIPTLGQSVWRYIVTVVALAPFALGYLPMLFDKRRRALQDLAAQTVVLKGAGWFVRYRRKQTFQQEREELAAAYRASLLPPAEPVED